MPPRVRAGGTTSTTRSPKSDRRWNFVLGDSHAAQVVDTVRGLLQGRQVDFLFIDGDHSYEGVKADWDLYRKLVAPDGLVAFHDIVPGPEERVGGVPRFWKELRQQFPHRELVESWHQGGYGIGVVLPNDRS